MKVQNDPIRNELEKLMQTLDLSVEELCGADSDDDADKGHRILNCEDESKKFISKSFLYSYLKGERECSPKMLDNLVSAINVAAEIKTRENPAMATPDKKGTYFLKVGDAVEKLQKVYLVWANQSKKDIYQQMELTVSEMELEEITGVFENFNAIHLDDDCWLLLCCLAVLNENSSSTVLRYMKNLEFLTTPQKALQYASVNKMTMLLTMSFGKPSLQFQLSSIKKGNNDSDISQEALKKLKSEFTRNKEEYSYIQMKHFADRMESIASMTKDDWICATMFCLLPPEKQTEVLRFAKEQLANNENLSEELSEDEVETVVNPIREELMVRV